MDNILGILNAITNAKKLKVDMQANTLNIDGVLHTPSNVSIVSNWTDLDVLSLDRTFILNAICDNIKINKGATLLPIKASALLNTNKGLISISFYGNEESSL